MSSAAKIYCFGDSNTCDGGYPEYLRGMLAAERPDVQWQVENGGSCGRAVSDSVPPVGDVGYLFKQAASSNIDIVLLMMGTNDAIGHAAHFGRKDMGEIESMFSDRLAQLAASIQEVAPGAELQIVTPPPLAVRREAATAIAKVFRKVMFQTARNLGITCIDSFSALKALEETESLKEDGIHITKTSGQLIASTILPHVLNSFSGTSKGIPAETDDDAASVDERDFEAPAYDFWCGCHPSRTSERW